MGRLSKAVGNRRLFDYDRSLLVNDVLRAAEDQIGSLDDAVERSGLSMGYPAWNMLYYTLLCSLPRRPATVIEVGANRGYSTIVMAQALRDAGREGTVHSIDIDPDAIDQARTTVAAAGLEAYVQLHLGDSLDVLVTLGQSLERFDFVLLDGLSEHEQVLREFALVHPRLSRGAIVYFDNSGGPGVSTALADIRTSYDGSLIELTNCSWWPPGNALWQADHP